jgi:antitoxin VapB
MARRIRMQTAKLFKNGRSQAVRLPKAFRFEGDEVYVKRVAGGVVLLSKADPWASIVEAYELADPKHPIKRHKPPVQKRSFRWR